ncbi:MAG: type II toxin-antitoxin system RelE/ParE family toxin [Deltaproteobacteria bacterium]|nr:type II toxin-antitoxin system RelE/ParE family toxin [Deltaproteobacteria bacterium]
MSLRRVVLPEAADELVDAVAWYEERRPGLGAEFFGVVDAGMATVCATPMVAAAWPGLPRYRRLVLQRFPYVLVYEVRGEEVEFVAVAHTSRRPGYWADRIRARET